jgi:hypothetical protein
MIISRLDTPAVMCDKLGSIYENSRSRTITMIENGALL